MLRAGTMAVARIGLGLIVGRILDSLVDGGKGAGSEFLLERVSRNSGSLSLHLSIHIHTHAVRVMQVLGLVLVACHWIRIAIHFVVSYWYSHNFLVHVGFYLYVFYGVVGYLCSERN